MKIEDLLKLIESYYTKDHSYSKDFIAYSHTLEYRRLEEVHEGLIKQKPEWDDRISKLNTVCNVNFYPLMPNHMDRCLSYQMKVGQQHPNVRLTLDISGLGNFFSLKLLKRIVSNDIYKIKGKDLQAMRQMRKLTSYVFIDPIDEYVHSNVVNIIQQYLEEELNLIRLGSNQLEQVIEGYEFDNRDAPFTFYSAFFTSDPMIQ